MEPFLAVYLANCLIHVGRFNGPLPDVGEYCEDKRSHGSGSPLTLDGMAYMRYATYDDLNTVMDLNQDYQAIRWLQRMCVNRL
jgi:hypothetical protein